MTDTEYKSRMKDEPSLCQRELFDEYYNYVYSIVFNKLRSCGSREDVDECVSDVFSDVFISLDSNKVHGGDIKGLIATIARRRAVDMFRKLSSKGKTDISIDDEGVREIASDERVDQLTEAAETANALLNAVKSLGQPDSTIIIQKYYYNKSSGEIAGAVSMKPAAVRQRISRALKRLNEILAAAGEER